MARRVAARMAPPDDIFVVSVGNLALGGTGKTPVTLALARDLAGRGLNGAVLTRGFGSRLKGPLTVDSGNSLAGDEARLMAASLADTPSGTSWIVVQARNRVEGLSYLRRENPDLDIVIAEDAHQTANLGRQLDIVILHRWEDGADGPEPAPGPVVPFGPWRESAAGAARAGIWLIEGEVGSAEPSGGAGKDKPDVVTFSRTMNLTVPDGGLPDPGPTTAWAALAGIARPGRFEDGATGLRGCSPVLAFRPGDHARYGPRMARRIRTAMEAAGAGLLVTTAKDWVKLEDWWGEDFPVLVADLSIAWGDDTALPDLVGERLDAWKDRAAR
jgi:tetraacyldisaccharide 4'-kinase